MINPRKAAWVRPVMLLLMGVGLQACQSASTLHYLAHVAAGQARIVLNQQDLASMDRSTLAPQEQANLALLDDIRDFARDVGLNIEGQYTRFYASDASWAVWVLTASPPTAPVLHRWEFPIAGRVPYLGFFSRKTADQFRAEYSAQGFHTALRTADAYSTLGWFDDPLFRAQLDESRPGFAATIFHELVHATVYQPGASDWNESVASFTEARLLELYQQERAAFSARELSDQTDREADSLVLRAAIAEIRADLEHLYHTRPESYPYEVTSRIDAWRAELPARSWRRLDGQRLARRPWYVPSLLGMDLYSTHTDALDAAWLRHSQGRNSVPVMQAWLNRLARCADHKLGYACFESAVP